MATETKGLSDWLVRFETTEVPVLASVVREINALTKDNDASVNQLTQAILKDGNSASKVLKLANSVIYNPGGMKITTISRAVVLLGFGTVRRMCVTAKILDTVLAKGHKDNLLQCLGDSFHAAVQAQNLCSGIDDEATEEIFLAALLSNVGEMIFWSCGGPQADSLGRIRAECGPVGEGYEEAILGTSFTELSMALAKKWSLGSLLQQALDPDRHPSPKAAVIKFGSSIATVAKLGFESDEFEQVVRQIAVFNGQHPQELMESICAQAENARSMAESFGIPDAGELIPTADPQEKEREPSSPRVQKLDALSRVIKVAAKEVMDASPDTEEERACQDDMQQKMSSLTNSISDAIHTGDNSYVKKVSPQNMNLQMEIMGELANMILERVNINTIFQLVLEGMHRAVDLKRVMISTLDSKTHQLSVKYMLGKDTESWRQEATFTVQKTGVLGRLCRAPQSLWLGKDPNEERDPQLATLLDGGHYFISALAIDTRVVGMLYADQAGQDLTEEQFTGFLHFLQQTNIGLLTLARTSR